VSAQHSDTIAALATPPGKGGIGILRISGPQVKMVAEMVLGKLPKPRYADYLPFRRRDGSLADIGIALYFPAPHSLTGEDVLELQGHGGPVVLDMLLADIYNVEDVRPARPGEFLERAFVNGKIDLAQAEAIADLIESASSQAAALAIRNVQGDFSKKITQLQDELNRVRMYVEAAIDFPEEEIDFLQDSVLQRNLTQVAEHVRATLQASSQGEIYREGVHVVIAGRPNAGKSTLLNRLSGKDSAIISDIAGTTRDIIQVDVNIGGVSFRFFDTAGLRESGDAIEIEGIKRARRQIELADVILYVVDSSCADFSADEVQVAMLLALNKPLCLLLNKSDLGAVAFLPQQWRELDQISLSSLTGDGNDVLQAYLLHHFGVRDSIEGIFITRRRHIVALQNANACIERGMAHLQYAAAGELLAEELRLAQLALSEITGEHSSDDLLADIFSQFCIGK